MDAEPSITINGRQLTDAQASTMRVAIANFLVELSDPKFMLALGEIGPLYRARAGEVQALMVQHAN